MKMKKIAICDDNKILLKKYEGMMNNIIHKCSLEAEIQLYSSGIELTEDIKNNKTSIDIIFLDILMDQLNGIETAKMIRNMKSKAIIIFLTSSEEYIFETMGIKAMAYLMKDELTPVNLENILLEAVKRIDDRESNMLTFEKDDGVYQISYQDVCFIKIYNGYYYIHHWDGVIFENNDPNVLEKLKDKGFYKVHAQYIVGLRYIDTIQKNQVILSDQSHNIIPLDKNCIEGLKITFADFMLENM